VLNGEPFIRHHIHVFRKLTVPWVWHVVEGLAGHVRDTAWGAKRGGSLPDEFLTTARSNDGTSEYLDELHKEDPGRVVIYRKPAGVRWDGKLEMVSAPLANIREPCLLWQVDADELWTVRQVFHLHELFSRNPDKTAAWFYCHFFVSPEFCSGAVDVYGNFTRSEWLRVWHFKPGDTWEAHEPPTLVRPGANGRKDDVGKLNPFPQQLTASEGLRFQHYAYVTEPQLRFKERYYGYPGAVATWHRLQADLVQAPRLRKYLPWVREMEIGTSHTLRTLGRTIAEPLGKASRAMPARREGVTPLAQQDSTGKWYFHDDVPTGTAAPHIVVLRSDRIGDHLLSFGLIEPLRKANPLARLTIVCPADVSCLIPNRALLNQVVTFDRDLGHADSKHRRETQAAVETVPVDLLICPQYNRDNLANKLSVQINAPRRVGFDSDVAVQRPSHERKHRRYARRFDVLVPGVPRDLPEFIKYGRLLQCLGMGSVPSEPQFAPGPQDIAAAEELLQSHVPSGRELLAVFPGAANSIRNVTFLGHAIRTTPCLREFCLVGLGSEDHRDLVTKTLKESGRPGLNLAGQTSLPVAAALLKKCRLALGADTGLGHLACAVGCRNVIILGGGDFGRFFPYSALTTAVCLPLECYRCHFVCRYDEPHCVTSIPLGTVRGALEHALAGNSSKPQIFVPKNEKLPDAVASLKTSNAQVRTMLELAQCELREIDESVLSQSVI